MLATLTKAHVRPLIDLNDQVNQLTSRESEINSTRIVVQGDQSHGKSSLLEALSGVDLPRGDDIKTRVPLIMQLRSCEDADQEHAFISRKGTEPERIALSGWSPGCHSRSRHFPPLRGGAGQVRRENDLHEEGSCSR